MTDHFEIESGIPVPTKKKRGPQKGISKYRFQDLQVGQSIFVPADGEYVEKVRNRITASVRNWHKDTKLRFTTQVYQNGEAPQGVRIWRVE